MHQMFDTTVRLPLVLVAGPLVVLFGCSSTSVRIIECVDGDDDGYAVGCDDLDGFRGRDCDDAVAECTADCGDRDGDGTADCAESSEVCIDADDDGYAVGCDDLDGFRGRDCDDSISECTVDCDDLDGDGRPDCASEIAVDWIVGLDSSLLTTKANALIETRAGEIVVVGEADAGDWYQTDSFLLKLDRQGDLLWSRRLGSREHDRARRIIETKAGGFVLAGLNVHKHWEPRERPWASKLDDEGHFMWSVVLEGGEIGWFDDVVELPDEGYLFAGETVAEGGYRHRALLVSFDSMGSLQWQNVVASPGESFIHSLSTCPDGTISLVGVVRSRAQDPTSDDAWVAKMTTDGEFLWQRTLGSQSIEQYGHGVESLDAERLLIGASSLEGMAGETWHLIFGLEGDLRGGMISSFHAGDGIGLITSVHPSGFAVTALEDQFLGASIRGVPLFDDDELWEIVIDPPEEGVVSVSDLIVLSDNHIAISGAMTQEYPYWEQAFIAVMPTAQPISDCDLARDRGDVSAVSVDERGEIPVWEPDLTVNAFDADLIEIDVATLPESFDLTSWCP